MKFGLLDNSDCILVTLEVQTQLTSSSFAIISLKPVSSTTVVIFPFIVVDSPILASGHSIVTPLDAINIFSNHSVGSRGKKSISSL